MSADADEPDVPSNNEYENVVDESGTVNQKHKEQILQARNRIDEREDAMFTGPLIDPAIGEGITHYERVKAMGRTVRMLIRRLRPLLVRDTVEGAEEYAETVELGVMTLYPPDSDGIPFSALVHDDINKKAFRRRYDLPKGVDLPQPVTREFNGLLSLLAVPDEIAYTWRVKTKTGKRVGPDDIIELQEAQPIPMHILERAVMASDDFMQEAGIGLTLDTGDPVGYT